MDSDSPNPNPPSPSGPPPLTPPPPAYRPPPPAAVPLARRESRGRGWKIAVLVLSILLGVSLLSNLSHAVFSALSGAGSMSMSAEGRLEEITLEHHHAADKIAVIPIEGIIASINSAGHDPVQLVEDQLKAAGKDDRVKAVLLKVNSPGGEVLASDEIYRAIVRFQEEHDKPVIASMSSVAASGGYYVSAPCRWIVANELTITGSIGVIMHTYNYRGLMNKVGLRPVVYKSGKFKDMLSGDKETENLPPDEKAHLEEEGAMVQKMINETFARFKTIVQEGRASSSKSNQANTGGATGRPLDLKWADYADGRILSGKEAYDLGFVDELGDWRTAIERAKLIAGLEKADLVTYQPPFNFANLFSLFGKSESKSVKIDLGLDLPRLPAGLYFLSPLYLR